MADPDVTALTAAGPQISIISPDIVIRGEGGRELLRIGRDGTVHADLDDVDEAARRFVAEVRRLMAPPPPTPPERKVWPGLPAGEHVLEHGFGTPHVAVAIADAAGCAPAPHTVLSVDRVSVHVPHGPATVYVVPPW